MGKEEKQEDNEILIPKEEFEKLRTKIEEIWDDFNEFIKEEYPELLNSSWYGHLYSGKEQTKNTLSWSYSLDDFGRCSERLGSLMESLLRAREEAKDEKEYLESRKNAFDVFKDYMPLFFTVKARYGCIYYIFSYEMKVTEDGKLKGVAFGVYGKQAEVTYYPEEYEVTPMTKEEFETEYLPKRLSCMHLIDEMEYIEKDNQFRNLFNHQNNKKE